jgi:hypothetical protein
MISAPLKRIGMVDTSFSHCPFNLLERNANADDRFNLQKTNAANEGWLADSNADAKSKKAHARPIASLILTA